MEEVKNEIVKASVKNSRCNVVFKVISSEEKCGGKSTMECDEIVHSDLVKALDKLKIHLVCITEQPESNGVDLTKIFDYDVDLSNYVVTGYSLGGSDENAGVTIIGQKLLKSGQVLNLISPFVKFEDTEAYSASGELFSDIEGCNYQVEQYLFHGHWGIKQQEIDFDAPDEANIDITVTDGDTGKSGKTSLRKLEKMTEEMEKAS